MKKLLTILTVAALLVFPLGSVALADPMEPSLPEVQSESFVHGDVPALTDIPDAMRPVLHGVVLAMVNHGAESFSADDPLLAWESLYNMVSLYGQMDNRSDYLDEALLLPSETVADYSAALFASPLSQPMPEELSDRMDYDGEADCWLVVCGADGLSEIRVDTLEEQGETLYVSGDLVYLVDESSLVRFEAEFVAQDNLLGYTLVSLELE